MAYTDPHTHYFDPPEREAMVRVGGREQSFIMGGLSERRVNFRTTDDKPCVVNGVAYRVSLVVAQLSTWDESENHAARPSFPFLEAQGGGHKSPEYKGDWRVEQNNTVSRAGSYKEATSAAKWAIWRALADYTNAFMDTEDGRTFLRVTQAYRLERDAAHARIGVQSLQEELEKLKAEADEKQGLFMEFVADHPELKDHRKEEKVS